MKDDSQKFLNKIFEAGIDESTLYGRIEEEVDRNKLVVFRVGEEYYALDVKHVTQIETSFEVNPLPFAPEYIRGVVQLRGVIISVTDLASLYRLQSGDVSEKKFIIVIADESVQTGLLVQGPVSFAEIDSSEFKEYTLTDKRDEAYVIQHQVEWKGNLVAVLDAKAILKKTKNK